MLSFLLSIINPNVSSYCYILFIDNQNSEAINNFIVNTDPRSLLLGIFIGLMLVMAIYNFLLYFSLRDKAYLYYVGTVIFGLLTSLAINKISGQYFWPNQPNLDKTIYITFAGISMFFSSRFAAIFLELKEHHKLLNKFMWVIACLSLLLTLLSFILTLKQITPFGRWLVLLSFPSYIIVAIIAYRKGLVVAKFYLLAWIPYVLGLLIRTMHGANWIPTNQLVLSSIEIGGALEIMLLSFALAYRIKKIQKENTLISVQLQEYISRVLILEEKIQSKNSPEENVLEKKIEIIAQEHKLTERETDVFLYLAKGLNNQKIADELFVSINTVKFHTRNIYEKLDIKKRNEINTRILYT
ncbi:7TM diverse intracellular signaling domain-containing protein [Polaribacter sp. Z022]|uniref:7TM diverse intracellular signaling domain-containing protein n=1 Tax=Polaribacter sp. Z022 TaxID=2927125 RepID=UPI00201FE5B9|nr:7TM diverse intracellular signaling domain-containing protein [Polaribacter sp. Z022]MCL7753649.1 LuxR C-terminal-related transcriptional regulator [Polaribacter sp. Z022]